MVPVFKESVFTGTFEELDTQYSAGIVGFHSGDSTHDYELPFSGTANISDLPRNSNIGVKGVYVYRVDQNQVEGILYFSLQVLFHSMFCNFSVYLKRNFNYHCGSAKSLSISTVWCKC